MSDRAVAGEHGGGDGQGEHRAGRVVQRRLGDDRLDELGAHGGPDEQRDEDRRIGGGEHRADLQAVGDRQFERGRRREAHH
jgi:hypothetical protein